MTVNMRGFKVKKCSCGRWVSEIKGGCCAPCVNGYPEHQSLCSKNEDLQRSYPRELIDAGNACPVCGASDMEPNYDWLMTRKGLKCRDNWCKGRRD